MPTEKTKFFHQILFISILLVISACQTSEKSISQDELRELAQQYRNEWLSENERDSPLVESEIKSIEETENGWHFIYLKETGHDQPEGRHDYYLHIYIDKNGKLLKVIRGPDLLS